MLVSANNDESESLLAFTYTDCKFVPANAPLLIVTSLRGNATLVSELQPSNALSPMYSTDCGKTMLFKLQLFKNAHSPIHLVFPLKVTSTAFTQSAQQYGSMLSTFDPKVNV